MLKRLADQAALYGVRLERGRVTSLERRAEGGFVAKFGAEEILARYVLMATGLVDERPSIDGLVDRVYDGAVRFCPICDGYEAMDCRIGVLGGSDEAIRKALFLRTYTREVTLFPTDETVIEKQDMPSLKRGGVILGGKAIKVERLENKVVVFVETGERCDLDVLYPALGCKVRSDLATSLGAACNAIGNLQVDDHHRSTVESLYGAGDVVTDLHQLSVAIGHAAIAATDIHNRLERNLR